MKSQPNKSAAEGKMKTCNCDDMCEYKTIGNPTENCKYAGYCDYQRPIDSRGFWGPQPIVIKGSCNCTADKRGKLTSGWICPEHGQQY